MGLLTQTLGWRTRSSRPSPAAGQCGSCRHFRNDPVFLEAAIPGLASLSSGAASVRADDGLCLLCDRYLGARNSCAHYAPAAATTSVK